MKMLKTLIAVVFVSALVAATALAAEKTCCEKARADGKNCTMPCCVAAHKDGKSCEKCNSNQEDLKKTCCQEAKAAGKECPHKCCIAAHKDGKSCVRCNPNKEDLKKIPRRISRSRKRKPINPQRHPAWPAATLLPAGRFDFITI